MENLNFYIFVEIGAYYYMCGWAKCLMAAHCFTVFWMPLRALFHLPGCLFLPSFSLYPPPFSSSFLSLFNDFQLFIIQRKAGSRRLWLNPCPPSATRPSLLLFSLPRPIHARLPFTSSLSIILPPSRIFVFHSSSHWPINHLCWREQPAVLCNLSPPRPPCL